MANAAVDTKSARLANWARDFVHVACKALDAAEATWPADVPTWPADVTDWRRDVAAAAAAEDDARTVELGARGARAVHAALQSRAAAIARKDAAAFLGAVAEGSVGAVEEDEAAHVMASVDLATKLHEAPALVWYHLTRVATHAALHAMYDMFPTAICGCLRGAMSALVASPVDCTNSLLPAGRFAVDWMCNRLGKEAADAGFAEVRAWAAADATAAAGLRELLCVGLGLGIGRR